jgi:hypothetical protein
MVEVHPLNHRNHAIERELGEQQQNSSSSNREKLGLVCRGSREADAALR